MWPIARSVMCLSVCQSAALCENNITYWNPEGVWNLLLPGQGKWRKILLIVKYSTIIVKFSGSFTVAPPARAYIRWGLYQITLWCCAETLSSSPSSIVERAFLEDSSFSRYSASCHSRPAFRSHKLPLTVRMYLYFLRVRFDSYNLFNYICICWFGFQWIMTILLFRIAPLLNL